MRKIFTAILFFCAVSGMKAQSFSNVEKEVRYIEFPQKPLPATVKTYNYIFNPGEIDFSTTAFDCNSVYAFVRIDGYKFQKDNSDVTLKLNFSTYTSSPLNVVKEKDQESYYASFDVSIPVQFEVQDRSGNVIASEQLFDKMTLRYPSSFADVQATGVKSFSQALVEKLYSSTKDKIDQYIKETAMAVVFANLNDKVKNLYSYTPNSEKVVIMNFKSGKNEDFTEWNTNVTALNEALNAVNAGSSPKEFEQATQTALKFWQDKLEKYLTNEKNNEKQIGACVYNIALIQTFANHFDKVKELNDKYNNFRWKYDDEFAKLIKFASSWEKHYNSSIATTADYKTLAKILPLKMQHVDAQITTTDGKTTDGIIILADPFCIKPYQNNYNISFVTPDDYIKSFGHPDSKVTKNLKMKEVKEYTAGGKDFVLLDYRDPNVLALSKNENLCEVVVKGTASLYIFYDLPSDGTMNSSGAGFGLITGAATSALASKQAINYVLAIGSEKPVVFISYEKLCDLLSKCPAVVDKIKKGEYGNPPVKVSSGKLFNRLVENSMKNTSEEKMKLDVIVKILNDYNAQMK